MKTKLPVLAIALAAATELFAGGALETYRRTGISYFPGFEAVQAIPMKWDTRSIPVQYSMNQAPIQNPLGAPVLTVPEARAALQSAMERWNEVPTSFIDMKITATTNNPGLRGFDMVNELTFSTPGSFTSIASSPSVTLIADSVFTHGDDIDGDGDADVSNAIGVTTDVDGDGDLEFPAGFYPAGTILDNDVQFNTKATEGYRFTVLDSHLDTNPRSVDLVCVAVHEFGHSFGLSHVLNNQSSADDGRGGIMFPFIDTRDPHAELSGRSLDIDDVAWVSYFYPEGSASAGVASLQAGDVAFSNVFGLITGEVRHGMIQDADGNPAPIAGASVFTVDRNTGRLGPSGYSGTAFLHRSNTSGRLFFSGNRALDIADGRFVIPVPKGNYSVGVEAIDGNPAAVSSISYSAQIGNFYGLLSFNEEYWNNNKEAGVEVRPGQSKNVAVHPGKTSGGVDFVTSSTVNLNPYGPYGSRGFINTPAGFYYAVRFPLDELLASGIDEFNVHSGLIHTLAYNASVPVVFSEAMLVPGNLNADGSISVDIANPLERQSPFVGQDNDFAPLFVKNPHETGRRIRRLIGDGSYNSLFLVVRNPLRTPFPGITGQPPLVGLSIGNSKLRSYVSSDGASWRLDARLDFRFSLVLSQP